MKKVISIAFSILVLFTMAPSTFANSNKPTTNPFIEKMQSMYQSPEMEYWPETRW